MAPVSGSDYSARTFAVADDSGDAIYVIELLEAEGQSSGSEGNRTAGYWLTAVDPEKARACIMRSVRFRTGDLRVFFLQHPQVRSIHEDDSQASSEWRSALRRLDEAAKLLPFRADEPRL